MFDRYRLAPAPARHVSGETPWRRAPLRPQDQELSRVALAWLDLLPARAQPLALCARYPRIANRLAVCWADPVLTDLVSSPLAREAFQPFDLDSQ